MRNGSSNWKKLAGAAFLLALVVGLTAPAHADGRRVTAEVDRPFVIDGRVFDAGRISVQSTARYTPGTDLNEVWVDNECIGYYLSRTDADPVVDGEDRFRFRPDADGRLVLVGYQLRGEASRSFYSFRAAAGEWVAPKESGVTSPVRIASR